MWLAPVNRRQIKPQQISRHKNTLRLCSRSNLWHSCFLPSKCLFRFLQSLSLSLSLSCSLSLSIFLCVFIRSRAAGCTCSWRKHRNLPLPSFDTRVTGSQYKRTAVGLGVHLSQEPIKGARNKPTKRSYDCNVSHANGMMTAAAWNSSSGTACKSTTFGSGCRGGRRDLGRRELLGSKVGNRQH